MVSGKFIFYMVIRFFSLIYIYYYPIYISCFSLANMGSSNNLPQIYMSHILYLYNLCRRGRRRGGPSYMDFYNCLQHKMSNYFQSMVPRGEGVEVFHTIRRRDCCTSRDRCTRPRRWPGTRRSRIAGLRRGCRYNNHYCGTPVDRFFWVQNYSGCTQDYMCEVVVILFYQDYVTLFII